MASDKVQVIGGHQNFWIWSKSTGFDLTHPPTPNSPPIHPRLQLATTKEHATIDPAKTALVVIDYQNYFLSPSFGRPPNSVGLAAVDKLLQQAIPACRTAGIPIVWLGWGLTNQELDELPPTIIRGFGLDTNFVEPRELGPLGSELGPVTLPDGNVVEAGRCLIRDQWNTTFHPTLMEASEPQDMHVYKNRLSGFWGGTSIEEILTKRGIRTLLFSGGNTDQCVAGSMQDAYQKGWDVLMLSDGCGTTSPEFTTQCTQFNCENGWGFVLTCQQLVDGVNTMKPQG